MPALTIPSEYLFFLQQPPTDDSLDSHSRKEEFISLVKYDSIASVLRQFDRSHTPRLETSKPLVSNYTPSSSSSSQKCQSSKKPPLLPHELANLKLRCKCKMCGKYGHWETDHNSNGSLPDGTSSNDERSRSRPPKRQPTVFDSTWPQLTQTST